MQYLIGILMTLGFVGLASTAFADKFKNFNKSVAEDIQYESPENKFGNYQIRMPKEKQGSGRAPASIGPEIRSLPKATEEIKGEHREQLNALPSKW